MTAINFPDSPAVDDQFTAGGKVWTWDGTVWNASPDIDTITQQVTSNIVAGAPSTLDTLNELAAALGDNEDFAATVTTSLSLKQDRVTNVSNTEIGYLANVTSDIQGQLDDKLPAQDPTITIDTGLVPETYTRQINKRSDAYPLIEVGQIVFDGQQMDNVALYFDAPVDANVPQAGHRARVLNVPSVASIELEVLISSEITNPPAESPGNEFKVIDLKFVNPSAQNIDAMLSYALANPQTLEIFWDTGEMVPTEAVISPAEILTLNGVTSNIQTQLNTKIESNAIFTSATAPTSPTIGQLWWKSDTGTLFIRYDGYWVEAVQRLASVNAPMDGTTEGRAVRFPSDLVRAGQTTSGEYWLRGKGTTPHRLYCFYDGSSFWARVANIPRNSVLNFNGYTTTVGTDFSLANTSLFNLETDLFGNQNGTDLQVMLRLVGGSFVGAVATTPGVGTNASLVGIPLSMTFNGTATQTATLPTNTAAAEFRSFDGSSTGVRRVTSSLQYVGSHASQSNFAWSCSATSATNGASGEVSPNDAGWVLFSTTANTRQANTFFGTMTTTALTSGESTWSRAEIYVRI